ncbi:Uncharacterised protein [uncultured archaeon]|nr:Uncharacterised protein [uncultured archaeon]
MMNFSCSMLVLNVSSAILFSLSFSAFSAADRSLILACRLSKASDRSLGIFAGSLTHSVWRSFNLCESSDTLWERLSAVILTSARNA